MSRKLALGAIWAIVFSPSLIFAQDRKTDPDPAVLPSARTMALAAVDANYDLGSPRTPFPARFAACAGKLSAARQDGRAMPLGKPEIDQAISSFRSLAVELLAHRNKLTREAAGAAVDKDIALYITGAVSTMRELTQRLGVARQKALNTEHLQACRLMRAWYEVQNGIRQPVPVAERAQIAAAHARFVAGEKAAAPTPPGQRPQQNASSAVSSTASSRPPLALPPSNALDRYSSPLDTRIGTNISPGSAHKDFAGRPVWIALAECSGRVRTIESRTATKLPGEAERLRDTAASVLSFDRKWNYTNALAWVALDRRSLEQRANMQWDEYQRIAKTAPTHIWIASCRAMMVHADPFFGKIADKLKAENEKARAAQAQQLRNQQQPSSGGGGGWVAPSTPSNGMSSGQAAHQRVMQQHQGIMQQYERENRQLRR